VRLSVSVSVAGCVCVHACAESQFSRCFKSQVKLCMRVCACVRMCTCVRVCCGYVRAESAEFLVQTNLIYLRANTIHSL